MLAPQRPDLPGLERLWLRHEAVTGLVLHDQTPLPSWARRVLTGHHGRYQPGGPQRKRGPRARPAARAHEGTRWSAAQSELLRQVQDAVGAQPGATAAWRTGRQRADAAGPLHGGCHRPVCVCDWVASDETFTCAAPLELLDRGDATAYLKTRLAAAEERLQGVLLGNGTPVGDFSMLFAGRTPRGAAQRWASERRHGSGLTLVMVPMGEGKTEVALQMHAADDNVPPGAPAGTGCSSGCRPWQQRMRSSRGCRTSGGDQLSGAGWRTPRRCSTTSTRQALCSPPASADTMRSTPVRRITRVCIRRTGSVAGLGAYWRRHRRHVRPGARCRAGPQVPAGRSQRWPASTSCSTRCTPTTPTSSSSCAGSSAGWGAYRCRVTLLSATLPRARVGDLVAAWSSGWYAGAAPTVHDEMLAALPATLSYPAVVTVAHWRTLA
jgi:hypothetical protein